MVKWLNLRPGRLPRLGLALAILCIWAGAALGLDGPPVSRRVIRKVNNVALLQEPSGPSQPDRDREPAEPQPETSASTQPEAQTQPASQVFGGKGFAAALEAAFSGQTVQAGLGATAASTPATATVLPQSEAAPPPSIGAALQQSDNVQTLNTLIRNPVSLDPRIRGYRYGQIYNQADGAFWQPIRQDLDTPLSMIDPSVVQSVEVVPGPYSLQNGPGFSFLNVTTTPTPRYDHAEGHMNLGNSYYGNGDQLNAHQRFYGGNKTWGFSILHGTVDGNPYRAGNGDKIPAGYNNENLFAQFGADLDPDRHVEFRYLRQDQANTQYPGQFFKIDQSTTQGFNLQYVDESTDGPWDKLIIQSWYSNGRLRGGTDPNETYFNIVGRVDQALANVGFNNPNFSAGTNAGTTISGARVATVYGEDGDKQLTVGSDLRYINQYVAEQISVVDMPQGMDPNRSFTVNTGMPRAYQTDPGVFAELVIPVTSYWTTTAGTRADWIHSDVLGQLRPATLLDPTQLNQSHGLYAFFLTNKVELDEHWTTRFGFGRAQRPPTLTERYADGEFLALIQSGLSRSVGNPNQGTEGLWQVEANLSCNYDHFRGRMSGFFSSIHNFSTFGELLVPDPTGARFLFTQTTPLATLAGFEAYGERDLNKYWTAFGSGFYIDGRDQTLSAPLTQIYPLEGRLGLRLHDPDGGKVWGLEALARMVDHQHRLGTLRVGTTDVKAPDPIELPTAGFTVFNLRGYYNVSKNFNVVGGINNLFNRNYLEHLSLRFAQASQFPSAAVLSSGITPYVGMDWTY